MNAPTSSALTTTSSSSTASNLQSGQLNLTGNFTKLEDFESPTISPRVKMCYLNEALAKLDNIKESERPPVIKYSLEATHVYRFLTKKLNDPNEIEQEEKRVFNNAIQHLNQISSGEDLLKTKSIPRTLQQSNVVLVDFFKKNSTGNYESENHTICLWKKTNSNFLIIDPSSYQFSRRFEENNNSSSYKITAKNHIDDKFYENLSKITTVTTKREEGENTNKDYRDCIDVALKIAFSLNYSQQIAYDLSTVESRIDYLSNQKSINYHLLQGGKENHIGWLQNSDHHQREEAIRLLFENKDYLEIINDVQNIDDLRTLNNIRLEIAQSSDYLKNGKFLKHVKESFKNKITLDQFRKCLNHWKQILKDNDEIKKVLNPQTLKK